MKEEGLEYDDSFFLNKITNRQHHSHQRGLTSILFFFEKEKL